MLPIHEHITVNGQVAKEHKDRAHSNGRTHSYKFKPVSSSPIHSIKVKVKVVILGLDFKPKLISRLYNYTADHWNLELEHEVISLDNSSKV